MAKHKIKLSRQPPKRTLTKRNAVRHLIHSAVRLICAEEDPFAVHLLVQSADKLLIDLAKKTKRKLPFKWGEFVKPEYEAAIIATIRETSNFFKHADKDHDKALPVVDIAQMNILQLGICVVNFGALFGEWTDHMRLGLFIARVFHPDGFVRPNERERFDAMFTRVRNMTFAEFLSGWWSEPLLKLTLPNLNREKAEDLQDNQPLFGTRLADIAKL
jgi:hypothetical protein